MGYGLMHHVKAVKSEKKNLRKRIAVEGWGKKRSNEGNE